MIHVDLTGAAPFFGAHTPDYAAAEAAHRTLSEKTGAGSDFLGWTELPRRIRETELARILTAGKAIREKKAIDTETDATLRKVIQEFKDSFLGMATVALTAAAR